MTQELLDFFRALEDWLEGEDHREGCRAGQIVEAGPLAGNKYQCTCGLGTLLHRVSRINHH